MKIGIAAPVETSSIADLIGEQAGSLPAGYPGAPLIGILARALIARGYQVSLYTTDSSMLPAQREPRVFKNENISIYYCPSRPRSFTPQDGMLGRMVDAFRFERQGLAKAIKLDQPDVVHGHWAYEFAWAALDSGLPNVVTFHDSPLKVLRFIPNLYRFGRYLMARRTIKRAKHITTVSPYMQAELKQWANRDAELVPNLLADEWFSSAIDPARRDLSRPKIAMVMNGWDAHKNAEPALKAFTHIRKTHPEATLNLFGVGFGANEGAEQWCKKNGLSTEGMKFQGRIPYNELLKKLAEQTLLIHPSLEESFGMTIAEAMALSLPVIGGDKSGAVPWLVEQGKVGLITDVRNEMRIVQAVLSLLNNEQRYLAVSMAAQQSARSRFSSAAVAASYEAVYLKAADLTMQ